MKKSKAIQTKASKKVIPLQKPSSSEFIYFDHHATTPCDTRVFEKMAPYFCTQFGNPASAHQLGRQSAEAVEYARSQVAGLLSAHASEIIFTSGATESINWVLKTVMDCGSQGNFGLVTAPTEHKATLESCHDLESRAKAKIHFLSVDDCGRIDLTELEKILHQGSTARDPRDRIVLVSLMGANNEIGTIHSIAEVSKLTRKYGVLLHVDGAQWVGKCPVNVKETPIDFISISAHKIYGPKGMGALYVSEAAKCRFKAMLHGGSQECSLRAGSLAVPLIVGLGEAADLCRSELIDKTTAVATIRDYMQGELQHYCDVRINGDLKARLDGNLSVEFRGIEMECLKVRLKNVAFSSTSACSSSSVAPSYVLKAIGRTDQEALSTLRFGLGRTSTREQVDAVVAQIRSAYEMFAA